MSVQGISYLSSNLSVQDYTDLVGRVQLGNTLSITGNTELSANLSVIGDTELGGTLSVLENTKLSANLSVMGDTMLAGTLDVEGNTTYKDLRIGNILGTTTQYGLTFNNNLDTNHVNKVFFFEENGQLIIAKEEIGQVVRKHIFR